MVEETTDLFDKLNSVQGTRELNNYIKSLKDDNVTPSFAGYISYMINERGLKKSDVISKSLIERTYGYQILNGIKRPGRDKIIALSLSAGLTLPEIKRGLEIAKEGILYPRDTRDAIIIFAVNNGYSVRKLNSLLEESGLTVLN